MTRAAYGYVQNNPLNEADATGMCGVLMNVVFGLLCDAETALAQSGARSQAGAQAASTMAQGARTVHDAVWQHAVIGVGYCQYACGSVSFQSRQLSTSGGGAGWGKFGFWAGVAGKQASQRDPSALFAGGAAGWGVQGSVGLGPPNCNANSPVDNGDWEADLVIGTPGGGLGYQHNGPSFDLNPITDWLGGL